MRPRCAWSHQPSDDLVEVTVPATDPFGRVVGERTLRVLPGYEEPTRAFAALAARWGRRFLLIVGLCCAGLIVFGATGHVTAAGMSLAAMGVVLLVLPFCTPQTVELFGLRASIRIARAAGLVVIALGVGLALLLG